MQTQFVTCTKCKSVLAGGIFNNGELTPCPSCTAPIRVDVFPALFREQTITHSENVIVEGESSCFYHPQKKAAIVCEGCGRFLCALCDLDFNGQHVCPSCLETAKKKGKIKNLQNHRTLHDNIALVTAILPLILFYFTIITAPLALYLSIRHWNSPSSIIPRRTKVRFVIAIIFASLQIIGWMVGIYFIFKG